MKEWLVILIDTRVRSIILGDKAINNFRETDEFKVLYTEIEILKRILSMEDWLSGR